MPILFRDNAPGGSGPRTPPWLDGLAGLFRAENLLFMEDPAYLPTDASAIRWANLSDTKGEWSVGVWGDDLAVNQYLRKRGDLLGVAPVSDSRGRTWVAPQILNQDGTVRLTLPWGKDASGVRTRIPTPEQAALIAVANAARSEVLATQLADTPVDVVASWVLPLLLSLYHLPECAFDDLALLDDRLGVEVVLTAIGHAKSEAAANG